MPMPPPKASTEGHRDRQVFHEMGQIVRALEAEGHTLLAGVDGDVRQRQRDQGVLQHAAALVHRGRGRGRRQRKRLGDVHHHDALRPTTQIAGELELCPANTIRAGLGATIAASGLHLQQARDGCGLEHGGSGRGPVVGGLRRCLARAVIAGNASDLHVTAGKAGRALLGAVDHRDKGRDGRSHGHDRRRLLRDRLLSRAHRRGRARPGWRSGRLDRALRARQRVEGDRRGGLCQDGGGGERQADDRQRDVRGKPDVRGHDSEAVVASSAASVEVFGVVSVERC